MQKGESLLTLASRAGDAAIARLLLQQDPPPAVDTLSAPALQAAAQHWLSDVLSALTQDEAKDDAFELAEVIQRDLKEKERREGKSPTPQSSPTSKGKEASPVHLPAQGQGQHGGAQTEEQKQGADEEKKAELLEQVPATPRGSDSSSSGGAASKGDEEMVETALIAACRLGHEEIVRLILEHTQPTLDIRDSVRRVFTSHVQLATCPITRQSNEEWPS